MYKTLILCCSLWRIAGTSPAHVDSADDHVTSDTASNVGTNLALALADSSSLIASSDRDLSDPESPSAIDNFELADCNVSSPTAAGIHPRQLCSTRQVKKKRPWRVLRRLPKPTVSPSGPLQPTDPNEICKGNAKKTLYLGCSGPEIWYDGKLGLVLNCAHGVPPVIPESYYFNQKDSDSSDPDGKSQIGQYCCNDWQLLNKLFAGVLCDRIPDPPPPDDMKYWSYNDLDQFLDNFTEGSERL